LHGRSEKAMEEFIFLLTLSMKKKQLLNNEVKEAKGSSSAVERRIGRAQSS
jgi:hypothetical protein